MTAVNWTAELIRYSRSQIRTMAPTFCIRHLNEDDVRNLLTGEHGGRSGSVCARGVRTHVFSD